MLRDEAVQVIEDFTLPFGEGEHLQPPVDLHYTQKKGEGQEMDEVQPSPARWYDPAPCAFRFACRPPGRAPSTSSA
jgi:hypothetical protein